MKLYISISIFISTLLTLATSVYTMQVYDRVIPGGSYSTLITLTAGVFIAILLELVVKFSKNSLLDFMAIKFDSEEGQKIFKHFLNIKSDFIPKSIGTLSSQIQGYSTIRAFFVSSSVFLIEIGFSFFFLFFIFFIGGLLGLIPLFFFIVSLAIGLFYKNKIENASQSSTSILYKKTGFMIETIENIEYIKSYSMKDIVFNKWSSLVNDTVFEEIKLKHISENAMFFTVFIQQISYVLLVCIGSYLVVEQSQLSMGGLLAITIISGRMLQPIGQLPSHLIQWGKAKVARNDLNKLYSLESESGTLTPFIEEASLKLENLSYSYSDQKVFDIASINIKEGEKVAILGPIGSGKTTLLKLLAGLYKPSSGKIFLNNIDLSLIDREAINSNISYLQQSMKLFMGTLRDNLSFGLSVSDEELISVCKKSGLITLINSLPKGLDTEIPEGGDLFSGGQKQLIGITRLLLRNKRIVLLDEPTASLDDSFEKHIINVFKSLPSTVIVVTHKPSVLSLVDRIIVLNNKQIILDGPKDAVLNKLTGRA